MVELMGAPMGQEMASQAGGNPKYEGGGPFASDNDPAESIPPIYDLREDTGRYFFLVMLEQMATNAHIIVVFNPINDTLSWEHI
jgi:hypothetical protein